MKPKLALMCVTALVMPATAMAQASPASTTPTAAPAQEAPEQTPATNLQANDPAAAATGQTRAPQLNDASTADIVVTAQRREERLQSVPISITALGGAQLETQGVRSVADLARVPVNSLTVQPSVGNPQILLIDMRGITTADPGQGTIEPGVAIYEDDVYVSRAQASGNSLSDPERIEVLRGPQGTLFGRNAEGGAIRIVTRKPTGVFGGDFRASIGEYGNRHYIGHLNLPEFAGISIKLDALHDDVGGYTNNGTSRNPLLSHQYDFGYQNNTGFRSAVRIKPVSGLILDYSYTHLVTKITPDYVSLTNPGQRAPASYPQFLAPARGTAEPDIYNFNDTSWTGLYQDVNRTASDAHSFAASYDVTSRLQLKAITGYRVVNFAGPQNLGGAFAFVNSPFLVPAGSTVASLNIQPAYSGQTLGIAGNTPVYALSGSVPIVRELRSRAFSQELQLIGSTDTLQYQFGAFYYHENVDDSRATSFSLIYTDPTYTNYLSLNPFQLRGAVAGAALGTNGDTDISAKSRTIAGYGQITWSPEFADGKLHLTGGLRYTDDQKDFLRTLNNGVPVNNVGTPFRAKRFDPMGTIAYDFTKDLNVYARYATGYKAAGVSVRSPSFRPFGLESVKSYEVGIKSQFINRALTINVALFQNDIRDRQLNFQIDPLNAPNLVDTVNTPGTTRVRGIEAEVVMRPTRDVSVSFNSAYTTFRLPPELLAINAALPVSAQANYTVQNTPEFQASSAVDWTMLRSGNLTLNAHADYAFASNVFGTGRIGITQFSWPLERHQGNARLTLDGIKLGPTTARLSIYANNITNEIYPIWSAPSANYIQNHPRQVGAELGVRF
ncbi:TonB-dependent receptor [Sphingomonas sp. 2378]|uniref:TonB-dependent receptor n=1 Tax=Sphingomonas sp. 2378 TaxID=1219748 RepID=UPI00311B1AEE